jgi:hypothetical protein
MLQSTYLGQITRLLYTCGTCFLLMKWLLGFKDQCEQEWLTFIFHIPSNLTKQMGFLTRIDNSISVQLITSLPAYASTTSTRKDKSIPGVRYQKTANNNTSIQSNYGWNRWNGSEGRLPQIK